MDYPTKITVWEVKTQNGGGVKMIIGSMILGIELYCTVKLPWGERRGGSCSWRLFRDNNISQGVYFRDFLAGSLEAVVPRRRYIPRYKFLYLCNW